MIDFVRTVACNADFLDFFFTTVVKRNMLTGARSRRQLMMLWYLMTLWHPYLKVVVLTCSGLSDWVGICQHYRN